LTWIAVAICGIQTATAQSLALSAVLQSTASPIAEKPLVTPTPFPYVSNSGPGAFLGKNATPTTLNSFLKHEGFGIVKLKQRNFDSDPKRLVIDVEINRVSALLEVDTGAGGTVIAQSSLKRFGLVEQKTPIRIAAFGKKSVPSTFWTIAKLDMLAIPSRMLGIPVRSHSHGFAQIRAVLRQNLSRPYNKP